MRIAQLYDYRDPAGGWRIDPDRPRIDDLEERARLGRFLAAGTVISHVPGLDDDVIDPDNHPGPPLSTHTDGTWIWSAGVRYYLLTHGIAPQRDFLAHIRACEYVAHEPDEPVVNAAIEQVRNG